jgi:hypothetical protein
MEIPADWRRFCAAFIEAVGANGRLIQARHADLGGGVAAEGESGGGVGGRWKDLVGPTCREPTWL